MPVYQYRAVTTSGREVTGEISADSANRARQLLKDQSLLPHKVHRRFGWRLASTYSLHWLLFVQSFQALLMAGLGVVEALDIARNRVSLPFLRDNLGRVQERVSAGVSLADAFAGQWARQDALWLATLRAGEASGDLPVAIGAYEEHLSRMTELRNKTVSAITYPLLLLGMIVLVVSVLLVMVLPKLTQGFSTLGGDLPWPTRALLGVSEAFPWAVLLMGIVVAGTSAWTRLGLTDVQKARLVRRIVVRVPLLGRIIADMNTVNLAKTLSMLIAAGTPFPKALALMAEAEGNADRSERLRAAADMVARGASVTEALSDQYLLPESGMQILAAGDRAGKLAMMLERVANFYKGALDASIQRFVSLAEPVLMLIIGLVIGAIVVAVYLPIFTLTQVLQ